MSLYSGNKKDCNSCAKKEKNCASCVDNKNSPCDPKDHKKDYGHAHCDDKKKDKESPSPKRYIVEKTCKVKICDRDCCEKVEGISVEKKLLNIVQKSQFPFSVITYEIIIKNDTCHKLVNVSITDSIFASFFNIGNTVNAIDRPIERVQGFDNFFILTKGKCNNLKPITFQEFLLNLSIPDRELSLVDHCKSSIDPCSISVLTVSLPYRSFTNFFQLSDISNTVILEACIEKKETKPVCPGECDFKCDDGFKHKKEKIQPIIASGALVKAKDCAKFYIPSFLPTPVPPPE